jgi:Ca2+-binding RTX toxin-like protein
MAGNDYLNGGLGADTLTGGLGSDMFDYRNRKDSFIAATTTQRDYDLITDFNVSQGDKILTSRAIASFNTSPATITSLTDTAVASALGSLGADSAALVKFGTRTFLAINDDKLGFEANSDVFIEFRSTGTLDNSIFTTL